MAKQLKKVMQKVKGQPSAYTQYLQQQSKQMQQSAQIAQQNAQSVQNSPIYGKNSDKLTKKSAQMTQKSAKTLKKTAKVSKKLDKSTKKVDKMAKGKESIRQKATGLTKNIGTRAYAHAHGLGSIILAAGMEASGNEQEAANMLNQGVQENMEAASYGNASSAEAKNNIGQSYMDKYNRQTQKRDDLQTKADKQVNKANDLANQAKKAMTSDAANRTHYPEIDVAKVDPTLAMNNEKMMHPEMQPQGPQMGR